MYRFWSFVALLGLLSGCSESAADSRDYKELRVVLPVGDAESGRQAFLELKCDSCHRVMGDPELQSTVAGVPGPDLGGAHAGMSGERLATSIIAPSHEIGVEIRARLPQHLSPMGDFSHAMTVRQLVDIVAYLQSLGG